MVEGPGPWTVTDQQRAYPASKIRTDIATKVTTLNARVLILNLQRCFFFDKEWEESFGRSDAAMPVTATR